MKTVEYKGKKIKTNYYEVTGGYGYYSLWDGNDVPACYDGYRAVGFRETEDDLFNKLVDAGYTRIRFVEVSTRVRGYHEVYAFYGGMTEED